MDYSHYTVDDFIADESFQRYCLKQDERDIDFWTGWQTSHPGMQRTLEEARTFILSLEGLNQQTQDIAYYHRKQAIRNKLRAAIATPQRTNVSSLRPWHLAAASVLILVCTLAAFYLVRKDEVLSPKAVALVYSEQSTLPGVRNSFQLPDGSVVYLNAGSRLRYPETFDGLKTRDVILEGEAFFEVVKDATKPFTVHSQGVNTTALGTSFTVRAYTGNPVSVALATGKVSVTHPTDSARVKKVLLLPGQGAELAEGSNQFSTFRFDSKEYLAWKDGTLYFSNAGEQEVIAKLENWFGVEITKENKSTKKWEYTGEFHRKELSEVLTSIGFTMKFDYQVNRDTVILHYKTK